MNANFLMSAILLNAPLAFSPGPTNILCLSISSVKGFKGTLRFIAGLQVLPFFYSLLVTFGAGILLDYFSTISLYVKVVGSLYMVYLAISMLKSSTAIAKKNGVKSGFLDGVMAQAINPKNITIIITIYSVFSGELSDYSYGVALAFIITLSNMCSHFLWSGAASILIANKNAFLEKYQDKFFGLLLLIAVVMLWI